jgi:tRNA-2-methylthio-N6-dimethylallyladenosine synthase
MPDQVDEAVKGERLARLQALLETQRQAFNARTVGRTVPVLFERKGRYDGQIVGRSPYLQGVFTSGPDSLIGQIAQITIQATNPNSLAGRLVETSAMLEPA